jgi:hypothetical protein
MGVRALKKPVDPTPKPVGWYTQNFWGFHWVPSYPENSGWVVLSPTGAFIAHFPTWHEAADFALPLRPPADG